MQSTCITVDFPLVLKQIIKFNPGKKTYSKYAIRSIKNIRGKGNPIDGFFSQKKRCQEEKYDIINRCHLSFRRTRLSNFSAPFIVFR